ncbi:MAG: hypothetical protein H6709_15865 [Kofleriaceae bacterium]|nr:hypothetical protein [Myxococcales bacterium]MCB9573556.1 hypothetical protein [Kofleriaceae bacterium]
MGLGLALAAGACTASSEEVRPPADQLFFPTGLAASPDESLLFVMSANSELRYDSGTVQVIDLATVDETIDAWLTSGERPTGCERDLTLPGILDCDEARFFIAGAGVRTGNFGANLAVQDLGGGNLRLVVPVRGDPSVTWIDWSAADRKLSCSSDSGFQLCDDAHRLTRMRGDDSLPQVVSEPFGVYVDSTAEVAMVTHLTSGTVTLVDLPPDGPPVLADVIGGLFASDPTTGARGATAVAGRTPGGLMYVTSRTENRVQTFAVSRPGGADALPLLLAGDYFFLSRVGTNAGQSSDTRGIAFGAGGDRAYMMNREPPSLALVDTSDDGLGFPRNEVTGATDLCREASGLAVADVGDGERAYVSCFQDGEVYVIDPRGGVEVEDIATIGRGPFSVVASPTRRRLYVSNFFENTVAVVDLTPGAPTQNRVVLRIGLPEDQ